MSAAKQETQRPRSRLPRQSFGTGMRSAKHLSAICCRRSFKDCECGESGARRGGGCLSGRGCGARRLPPSENWLAALFHCACILPFRRIVAMDLAMTSTMEKSPGVVEAVTEVQLLCMTISMVPSSGRTVSPVLSEKVNTSALRRDWSVAWRKCEEKGSERCCEKVVICRQRLERIGETCAWSHATLESCAENMTKIACAEEPVGVPLARDTMSSMLCAWSGL